MNSTRWVSFDCFGTLVDWRNGIRLSAELIAPGSGGDLLAAYHQQEHQVQQEHPGMRYRQVLAETLRRAARDAGIDVSADDSQVLGATIAFWPVFPEVAAELGRLRAAGWHLALLTNCDRDIISATQRRLGVPVDAVVTAEDAGAYKPSHRHFERFAEGHEVDRASWVHVAQSYFHDVVPAHTLGLSRIWINRLGEHDDPSLADAVQPDLTGLLTSVEKVHAARGAEARRLSPVRTEATAAVIAEQLRARIVDGTFRPGAQLAEAALAAQLGVSRGPVREALARLIQEGLLVNVRNRGVFVIELDAEDVLDIYRARTAIERFAVCAVCRGADRAAVTLLDRLVDLMTAAVHDGEPGDLVELDLRFHRELVEAAGSRRLSRMSETLAAETSICLAGLLERYPRPEEIVREHRELTEVLRSGDEAAALAAIDEHLESAVRVLAPS